MADRYTYVPYIGLFIALAWGGAELASWSRARAIALRLAVGVAIAALFVATWRQVGYWKDSYALFERAIAVTEDNAIAYEQLSVLHHGAGRFERAAAFGERAVAIRPDSISALNNLGNTLRALGRTEEAERLYARALEVDPEFFPTLVHLAAVRSERGEHAEAVDLVAAAFDANPALAEEPALAHGYVRSLRKQLEDRQVSLEEAASDYRRALVDLPGREELVDEFSWTLATHPEATPDHGREALELERSRAVDARSLSAVALDRLAAAYAAAGRFDEAVAAAERALERVGAGGSAFFTAVVRERLALYRSGQPYRDYERWGFSEATGGET